MLSSVYSHVVAQFQAAAASVAVLATDSRAVLLASIFACPGYPLSTRDNDLSTHSILAATDTSTPACAVGKDITTCDSEFAAMSDAGSRREALTAADACCIDSTEGPDRAAMNGYDSTTGILSAANTCAV